VRLGVLPDDEPQSRSMTVSATLRRHDVGPLTYRHQRNVATGARINESALGHSLVDIKVSRVGCGTMRLCGPGAFGPRGRNQALSVLRRAVQLGVNHIHTAQ
jgi:hypothetical protein